MLDYTQCDLCESPETLSRTTRQAVISSSEREFENEKFTLWQCSNCQCIHAMDGVDLTHYYSKYGLHEQNDPDTVTHFFFGRKLKWLERAGMNKGQRILDYGCGGGHFLRYLQSKGYQHVHGFDPFTENYANKKILEKPFDFVMSSDVIEHDIDVITHLETLIGLTTDDGFVYIETPNALAIDLTNIELYRQVLQQPFHRHILTHTWIIEQMGQRCWNVTQIARYPFFHSWIPFLNVPAMDHYWDKYGGLETLNEGYRWSALLSPKYWFLGLFGAFIYNKDEVQLVFRQHEK